MSEVELSLLGLLIVVSIQVGLLIYVVKINRAVAKLGKRFVTNKIDR